MARPLTITAVYDAQVDTAEFKSGTGSLLLANDGVTYTSWSYLTVSQPNYELDATGDFTVEAWCYLDVGSGYNTDHAIIGTDKTSGTGVKGWIFEILHNAAEDADILFRGADVSPVTVNINAQDVRDKWAHLAAVKSGSTLKIYLNGVSISTTSSYTGTLQAKTSTQPRTVYIGNDVGSAGINQYGWYGWLDEVRISNTARYTGNFIPATRFQPDADTLLLLHMDGADASTTFTDDVGVQGAANLASAFAVTSDRVENPSIVFLGNEAYTWDDTDTWANIYADADRWRAPERQFVTFTQTAIGTKAIFGDADLSLATSVTATALNIKTGSAVLDNQFTVTAEGRRLPQGAANLTVATAVTATAERLPQGRATLAMTTAVTAEGAVTITGESQLENTFNMQATGRILKLANIDITPFALLTADAQVDINAQANLSMSMTQTARGGLLINIDDPLPVTWDTIDPDTWEGFVKDVWDPRGFFAFNDIRLTAAGGTIKDAEANLASEFAVTAQGLRRVNAASDLASEFAVTAQGRRFVGGASIFDTPFNFTVSALNLDLATANLTVSFTLTVDVGRIVQGEIIIDDFFNFEVTAEKLKRASAELVTRFDLTASPTLIPNIILDRIESEFGVNVQGSVIVDGRADLQALATQLTVGQRLPGGSSNIDLEFAVTAIGAVIVDGRAELPAFAAMLSEGRISNVRGSATLSMQFGGEFEGDLRLLESDFILRIISETRVYALDTESRTQPILSETRSWSVDDEQRAFKILEETRTLELAN